MADPTPLTPDEFKQALPEQFRKSVNQDLIDRVNGVLGQPELYQQYRDNLLSYTRVMLDGKFKLSAYVDAVKYVGFKVMGCTNIEAYSRTFPEKIEKFHDDGVSPKDIASYVTAYNKGILVNKLLEQTLVPTHILNQDIFQKAINVQAELMMNEDVSPKVRSDAANSLLTHLKPPEKTKIELEVTQPQHSLVNQLQSTLAQLAAQQRQLIQMGGATARDMAHAQIIEVQAKEVDE